MFLASPRRSFDVVQGPAWLAPGRLMSLSETETLVNSGVPEKSKIRAYHLHELGVLHHHGMHDAQERFIAWEQPSTTSERVPLQHTLAGMLGQHLDDTSTLGARGNIPLEVSSGIRALKDCIEFVGDKLIRREDTERFWIAKNGYQNSGSNLT